MNINIDKKYTGFKRSYQFNLKDSRIEIANFKDNCIEVDHDLISLNKLLKMCAIENIKTIKSDYIKMITVLNIKECDINWVSMLGKENLVTRNSLITEKLNKLATLINTDYVRILSKRYEFTKKMTPAFFKDRQAERPKYCHVSSKTGRVKIESGINFLTMKREERESLTSSFVNGGIFEIDIVSLEPRVIMHSLGYDFVHDVYQHIKDTLDLKSDRASIKLGVLSTIYGASPKTVKNISNMEMSDVKKVKKYFKVSETYKELQAVKDKSGYIKNLYDRPLFSKQNLLNHYIQSTAADCACLAFLTLLQDLEKRRIKLLAFIHDSIIIDCHPEEFDCVTGISQISEGILGIDLPVKVERLS